MGMGGVVALYGLVTWCYHKEQSKLVRVPYNFGKPYKEREWSWHGPTWLPEPPTMTFMYNESLVTTPCDDITISVIFTPEFSPRSENWQAVTPVDLREKGKVAQPKDEVTDMSSIHLKSEFAFLTVWG